MYDLNSNTSSFGKTVYCPKRLFRKVENGSVIYYITRLIFCMVQEKYHASVADPKLYKVAWVGGCVMCDTAKLRDCEGFSFWKKLPENHFWRGRIDSASGNEEVWWVRHFTKWSYHQELTTTIPDRQYNAPKLLFTNNT
jgi:hypothetical protein